MFSLNTSRPPNKNCADDNDKENGQFHLLPAFGQKSLLFITGHSSGFVLSFALRKAASHCSRL